jgi:hypothetical protein
VRLAEEGCLSLERLAEVLPRITPKKEVHLALIFCLFSDEPSGLWNNVFLLPKMFRWLDLNLVYLNTQSNALLL